LLAKVRNRVVYNQTKEQKGEKLMNMQSLLDVFSVGITFIVPGVVWVTLAAGLYQFVRQAIHKAPLAPQSFAQKQHAG